MTCTSIRSFLAALALASALTAFAPRPICAQTGPDPNHAIFEAHVQRVLDNWSSEGLLAYDASHHAMILEIVSNMSSLQGLTLDGAPWPPEFWCGRGDLARILCGENQPLFAPTEFSGVACNAFMPLGVQQLVAQQIGAALTEGSEVHIVSFFPEATRDPVYFFPISLPTPHLPPERHCAAAPNSVGPGAHIEAIGSSSLGVNDLLLRAGPVPDQVGLFFLGDARVQLPFGDGQRCAGGQLLRLAPEQASGNRLEHRIDFTDPGSAAAAAAAGSTWNLQAWYRDPAAGGAGFNLSDALELTLCP